MVFRVFTKRAKKHHKHTPSFYMLYLGCDNEMTDGLQNDLAEQQTS
jgi:hypothetical protein